MRSCQFHSSVTKMGSRIHTYHPDTKRRAELEEMRENVQGMNTISESLHEKGL